MSYKDQKMAPDMPFLMPVSFDYCMDNAAMIGVVGLLEG